jgi:hypothetical protein
MKVAKIINDQIEINSIYALFPNTSFPEIGVPDSFLEENQLYKIAEIPQFNEETQKLIFLSDPILKNNFVYTFEIIDKSEEEINNEKWQKIRTLRNELLSGSDIEVVIDKWESYTEEQKNAWIDYRRMLRNIPQRFDNPDNVIWPTKPSVINNR